MEKITIAKIITILIGHYVDHCHQHHTGQHSVQRRQRSVSDETTAAKTQTYLRVVMMIQTQRYEDYVDDGEDNDGQEVVSNW